MNAGAPVSLRAKPVIMSMIFGVLILAIIIGKKAFF
jgi:hypothetical protein